MMLCRLLKRLWNKIRGQSCSEFSTVRVFRFLFLLLCLGVLLITTMYENNTSFFQLLDTNPKHVLRIISEGQGSMRIQSFNNNYKLNFEHVCEMTMNTTSNGFLKHLRIKRKTFQPELYSNLTKDCDKFISNMGYITESSTQEEKDFPIAFGIMVYKDVDQVERLLRAIYRPHNVYCIHIDSKSSIKLYIALKSIVSCLPNTWIASRQVNVKWGTFTVLEPEIMCQRELYAHKTKWRYYINLTGQEFPLKTNYELVQILKAYQGANDIRGQKRSVILNRVNPNNPPPHNITIYKGSLHMTASRAFIQYVLSNQTARDFLEWSKTMIIPDESYFTSLNNNKHLKVPGSYTGEIEDENRQELSRYKIWIQNGDKCSSRHYVRGICIFGMKDLPMLSKTPQLFANKFHYEYEPLTYDCLELWYRRKVNTNIKGKSNLDVDFYKNATFVKHRLRNVT